MSREVRRVPLGWQHPMEWTKRWDRAEGRVMMKLVPKPLFERRILEMVLADGDTPEPDDCYMPDFSSVPDDQMGVCMYETTSEGTPISPVFATCEELAHWLADNNASALGGMTATYEQWLAACRRGWSPSAVADSGGLRSGVEALGT